MWSDMSSEAKEEIYQDLADINVLFAWLEVVRLHVQPVWEELHNDYNTQFKSIELMVQVMTLWHSTSRVVSQRWKNVKQ